MTTAPIACTSCSAPLPALLFNTPGVVACPACAASLTLHIFPALLRPARQIVAGDRITDTGQAACFYHPQKTAHVPCDGCGRFICALCDVELQGQHLCPACVESGRRKGTLTAFENRRLLWDNIALATAVLPVATLALWFISFLTAPAALVLALIGWRKPGSLAPRTRARFVAAIAFSLMVIAGWCLLLYFLITERSPFESAGLEGTP
jgi:hypothetical protein